MNKLKKILAIMFFCPEDCVLSNVLLHFPVGIINVAIAMILFALFNFSLEGAVLGAWVASLFGWGFVRYELNEYRQLKDLAFQDIKGWLFGIGWSVCVFLPVIFCVILK